MYQYSRPLQDLATYVILYPSVHTYPLACATSIFEDKTHSTREPHRDISPKYSHSDTNAAYSTCTAGLPKPCTKNRRCDTWPRLSQCLATQVVGCLVKAWRQEED